MSDTKIAVAEKPETKMEARMKSLVPFLKVVFPAILALLGSSSVALSESGTNKNAVEKTYEVLSKTTNDLIQEQKQDRIDIATLKAENSFLKALVLNRANEIAASGIEEPVARSRPRPRAGAGKPPLPPPPPPAALMNAPAPAEMKAPPSAVADQLQQIQENRGTDLKQLPAATPGY